MSGIKRYDSNDSCELADDGDYVKFTDHEEEAARLRAELDNAAAAAVANMSLACEKEREADALRVDAMRYRWLRDTPWLDNHELARVIQMQKNALWDERIDAAMGADA